MFLSFGSINYFTLLYFTLLDDHVLGAFGAGRQGKGILTYGGAERQQLTAGGNGLQLACGPPVRQGGGYTPTRGGSDGDSVSLQFLGRHI